MLNLYCYNGTKMAEDMQQNYENDFSMDDSTDAQDSGSPVPPEISRDPEAMETDESSNNTGCKQDHNQRTKELKSMSKVVKKKEKFRKFQSENEQLKKQISELEERLRQEMLKNKPLRELQSENEQLKKQISELEESAPEETFRDGHTERYVVVPRPNQKAENLNQPLEDHLSKLQQKEEEIRKLQTQIQEATEKNKEFEAELSRRSSQPQGVDPSYLQSLQAQIEGLTQRNGRLEEEVRKLTSQANNSEGTEHSLQAQLQEAAKKNRELESDISRLSSQAQGGDLPYQQKLQAKNEELERSKAALQKEANDLSSKAHYLEQSFQERLQAEIQSLTENFRILKDERDCLFAKNLQENESWSKRVEELTTENCSLRDRETKQAKVLEKLKLEIKIKDDEIKNSQEAQKISEKETQAERRKLHQQITHLQEHNKSLNAGKMEAENQKRLKEDIIRQRDATIRQQQDTMEYFRQQYQQEMRERNCKIESLEKEKKDLTLRLSRLAGANLTYNNPNIADLSDENRPTKLAEEFSELYDNEWTDAFEVLNFVDEREKTQVMLNILEDANELCHKTTKEHTDAVKNGFITLNVRRDLNALKKPGKQTPAAALKETRDNGETKETSEVSQEVRSRHKEADGEETPPKTGNEKTTEGDGQPEKQTDTDAHRMEVDFAEDNQAGNNTLNEKRSATESADQSKLTAQANIQEADGEETPPKTGDEKTTEGDGQPEKQTDTDSYRMEIELAEDNHAGNNTLNEKQSATESADQSKVTAQVNIQGGTMVSEDKVLIKIEGREPSTADTNRQTAGGREPLRPVNEENSPTDLSNDPAVTKKEEQVTQQNDNHSFNNQFDNEEDRDEHSESILTAKFDDLTNEQKKTVSDIRRFFENKLSDLFHQESTKIITKSLPDNIQNEESLQKYIQKCLQLCWSMCRHEPPVFIHFVEPGSDKSFDTNTYKPYTKTGKYVDYIVWPALYLHEGGPMLAKGVAQGRK